MNLIRLQLSSLKNKELENQNNTKSLNNFNLNEDGEVYDKGNWLETFIAFID